MTDINPSCLFCRIIAGEIPATIRYQDDQVIAFDDVQPKAPTHILIIPKRHIANVDEIQPSDEKVIGALIYTAQRIARQQGIAETGYRLVMNVRGHAGQTVDHLHLHILGGKRLGHLG